MSHRGNWLSSRPLMQSHTLFDRIRAYWLTEQIWRPVCQSKTAEYKGHQQLKRPKRWGNLHIILSFCTRKGFMQPRDTVHAHRLLIVRGNIEQHYTRMWPCQPFQSKNNFLLKEAPFKESYVQLLRGIRIHIEKPFEPTFLLNFFF